MRDDLKFMRKPRWLDFAIRKIPDVAVSEQISAFDQLKLVDQVVIERTIIVYDTLTLKDAIDVFPPLTDTISLTDQVIAELHPPRVIVHVEDELWFTDVVKLHVDNAVEDQIVLADNFLIEPRIIAVDSLSLSDDAIVTVQSISQQQITVTDTLTLSDSVVTTLQQQQIIIPDSYAVYNHNGYPISADLSVWWDNDTGTTYNVYYSPPNPSNPRWVYLYFNNAVTLPRSIDIYISGYTPNKTLYIIALYYGELVSSTSITPTATGWYSVQLSPSWGDQFDEIIIYTDNEILGYIGIGEFHILSS